MNERIKELAEQAKQYAREQMAHPMNPMIFSEDVFQQKFAKAIIRECANIAREADSENVFGAGFGYEIASQIEEHFGVE